MVVEDPEKLAVLLKKKAKENNAPIWEATARFITKSRRRRVCVNLSRIDKYSSEGSTVLVPGKVLGAGKLTHKVIVGAFKFSEKAKSKIEAA
ncbi:TPA: 50S ribosomal protein L18e, partial [Candidatus Bathyarchaeota archaeon]|nr:50S ribosomal protein L18e [Candidatus Bathyarchaeota archaeon]